MRTTIYKQRIKVADEFWFMGRRSAIPRRVMLQDGEITLWYQVSIEEPEKRLKVYIFGTGHPIHDRLTYIDTVQQNGFVWHLYYDANEWATWSDQ